MRFLVGDIGGTNSRLAVYDGQSLSEIESTLNASIADPLLHFVAYSKRMGPFHGGCFGVAGPTLAGTILMTNLGWTLQEQELEEALGFPFRLINDFHAQALAMPHLDATHLHGLQNPPASPKGHMAVIGAGTGLGEALLAWSGSEYMVVAGEGSHGRFAPKTAREIVLLEGLQALWPDHVSVERVVSGPGLVTTYDILRGNKPRHPKMGEIEPAAVITQEGMLGDPECQEVLRIFVDSLADESASLALKCNATTVFISGGIPPRILPILEERFRTHFENKGRYRKNLERTQLFIVTYADTGLLGAGIGALEKFPL